MSGIWPGRCPEYGQFYCPYSRHRSFHKIDVRNKDSKNWPFPGHRFLMSGKWPVFTGHIPDINLAIFRTSRKGGLRDLIQKLFTRVKRNLIETPHNIPQVLHDRNIHHSIRFPTWINNMSQVHRSHTTRADTHRANSRHSNGGAR